MSSLRSIGELDRCSEDLGASSALVADAVAGERTRREQEEAERRGGGLRLDLPGGQAIDPAKQSLVIELDADKLVIGGRELATPPKPPRPWWQRPLVCV